MNIQRFSTSDLVTFLRDNRRNNAYPNGKIGSTPTQFTSLRRVPRGLRQLLNRVSTILQIQMARRTQRAPGVSLGQRFTIKPPRGMLKLLTGTSFLQTTNSFVPRNCATPNPTHPLRNRHRNKRLPPVSRRTSKHAKLNGATNVLRPYHHPRRPARLVRLIKVRIKRHLFFTRTTMLFINTTILNNLTTTTTNVKQINSSNVRTIQFGLTRCLRKVPIRSQPTIATTIFKRPRVEIRGIRHFKDILRERPSFLSFGVVNAKFFQKQYPTNYLREGAIVFGCGTILHPIIRLNTKRSGNVTTTSCVTKGFTVSINTTIGSQYTRYLLVLPGRDVPTSATFSHRRSTTGDHVVLYSNVINRRNVVTSVNTTLYGNIVYGSYVTTSGYVFANSNILQGPYTALLIRIIVTFRVTTRRPYGSVLNRIHRHTSTIRIKVIKVNGINSFMFLRLTSPQSHLNMKLNSDSISACSRAVLDTF